MNSPYDQPPDMSQQQMPMAPAAAPGYPSSMPAMHGYQHQPPPPLPPPSHSHSHSHSQAHPHQQQHQHQHPQHQHPPHPQHQHQSQHQPPPPHPHSLSHHHHQPPPPPPPPASSSHHHLQHHPLHQQPPLSSQHQQHQHQQSRPDEGSPTSTAPPTGESIVRLLLPFSKVDDSTGWKYDLDVVQQPQRARMCGFGDKDRRPITPPPCVRLVITDPATGKEIDCNDIDFGRFVLNVDLWNEEGTREVNLVRSSNGNPPASSTSSYPYSMNGSDSNPSPYSQPVLSSSREPSYGQSPAMGYASNYPVHQGYGQAPPTPSYPPNGSYGPPTQYFPRHGGGYREPALPSLPSQGGMAPFGNGPQSGYNQDQNALTRMAMGGQPQGMFTRNLIGSLAASAFRLSDTNDKIGVWFVLQDLSVRTEGPFRLRFSFVNVGTPGGSGRDANPNKVNQGRAPILASCFSEVFHVYSAKKFPGVCESTSLSKTFATQGIKIPIRKDTKGDDDVYMDGA